MLYFSSRDTQVDSLEAIIQSGGAQPLLYYELAELYSELDSNAAINNAELGLSIAENNQDEYGIAKGNFTLGNLHLDYN